MQDENDEQVAAHTPEHELPSESADNADPLEEEEGLPTADVHPAPEPQPEAVSAAPSGDDTSFMDEALEQRGLVRKIATRVPFLSLVLILVDSKLLAVVPRRVALDLTRICPLIVKEVVSTAARMKVLVRALMVSPFLFFVLRERNILYVSHR